MNFVLGDLKTNHPGNIGIFTLYKSSLLNHSLKRGSVTGML